MSEAVRELEVEGIVYSDDPSRLDLDLIHGFLTTAYWSPGIPRETVARAVAGSCCYAAYESGSQVAFARMVTDRATFAYLADVFVLPSHRGRGVGVRLTGFVLADPRLAGLRRLLLATRDAHGLYAKFGFRPLAAPDRFLEIHRPEVYRRPPERQPAPDRRQE